MTTKDAPVTDAHMRLANKWGRFRVPLQHRECLAQLIANAEARGIGRAADLVIGVDPTNGALRVIASRIRALLTETKGGGR